MVTIVRVTGTYAHAAACGTYTITMAKLCAGYNVADDLALERMGWLNGQFLFTTMDEYINKGGCYQEPLMSNSVFGSMFLNENYKNESAESRSNVVTRIAGGV